MNRTFPALPHKALEGITRRHFLQRCPAGLGGLWLATQANTASDPVEPRDASRPLFPRPPQVHAKAKRLIYLHMAGAPSQLELFVRKPELAKLNGQDCPKEFLEGKRFAFLRGVPQLLGPVFPFHQENRTGLWISDRLPLFEQVLDNVCFIYTMQTEQFNHAPGQLLVHTGNPNLGYASFGSWVTYGLGTDNQKCPDTSSSSRAEGIRMGKILGFRLSSLGLSRRPVPFRRPACALFGQSTRHRRRDAQECGGNGGHHQSPDPRSMGRSRSAHSHRSV
jgi:hypothetical protein